MPAQDPFDSLRGPGRNNALFDAMQAQKMFRPSAAAAVRATGKLDPLATSFMKGLEASRSPRYITSPHAQGASLAAMLKDSGGVVAAAENLRRASAGFAGPNAARDTLASIVKRGAAGHAMGVGAQHAAVAQLIAGTALPSGIAAASESARRATAGFAKAQRVDGALMSSKTARLIESMTATTALQTQEERPFPTALPPIESADAEMLKLQRSAQARRAEQRAIENEQHAQMLAAICAMRDAFEESEAARAADAKAAALREQALVDRAVAAEDRADASDKREAHMVKLTTVSVGIGVLSLLAAIAAVVTTILVAT